MLPTRRRLGPLIAGSFLLIAVAACSPTVSATPTAPAAQPVALRTPAAKPQGCMDALIGGKLTRHVQSGLGITAADGQQTAVEWPFGYSAWLVDGRIVLHDETGKTVAREGDEISMGGGLGNQLWYGCGPVAVTRALN